MRTQVMKIIVPVMAALVVSGWVLMMEDQLRHEALVRPHLSYAPGLELLGLLAALSVAAALRRRR